MPVAYVCEGGSGLGWGHVGRGRALLEAAPAGSALLLGRGYDEIARWCETSGVRLSLRAWRTPSDPIGRATEFDLVVVDDYVLLPEWLARSTAARPTFVVDDWMRRSVSVTGLVNPNVGAQRGDYPEATARHWLLGANYALLRREVRCIEPTSPSDGVARRVVVTLGGSDPGGITAHVATEITKLGWYEEGGAVTIVLGASYCGPEPWGEWSATRTSRLEVVRQPADFARRCAVADLVISGASTTTYELAYLERPFIPLALVDNQARIADEWARLGVGAALATWQADWQQKLIRMAEGLVSDGAARRNLSRRTAGLVDGRGVDRLLAAGAAVA